MSGFTINGKPAGYFIHVMERHAKLCEEAIEGDIITRDEAETIKAAVLSNSDLTTERSEPRKELKP